MSINNIKILEFLMVHRGFTYIFCIYLLMLENISVIAIYSHIYEFFVNVIFECCDYNVMNVVYLGVLLQEWVR